MINLKAQKRTLVGKRAKTIRKDGLVPAIVYGHGIDNVVISVPIKEFQKAS
ncbi:MAG: 50S ribosomal protein L25, partial [Parcubacteria group bacterium]|nr:50S ribosomal protein L25 [Parcubacteria group bacterium]